MVLTAVPWGWSQLLGFTDSRLGPKAGFAPWNVGQRDRTQVQALALRASRGPPTLLPSTLRGNDSGGPASSSWALK